MKIETLPLVIVTALVLPTGALLAEDSSPVTTQNRETVQEMSTVEQQSRWEHTVRQYDRNGDGRLDDGEKYAALEKNRLQNEEMVRQLSGSPSGPAPQGDPLQIRDRDQVQTQDRQQLEVKKQAMIRQYDADKDGSLSDAEFNKALATLDRDRDAIRDRLKDKTAAKDQAKDRDQTKDQLKQEDQLRRQDRTFHDTTDLDRESLLHRERVSPSTQPGRGRGRGR